MRTIEELLRDILSSGNVGTIEALARSIKDQDEAILFATIVRGSESLAYTSKTLIQSQLLPWEIVLDLCNSYLSLAAPSIPEEYLLANPQLSDELLSFVSTLGPEARDSLFYKLCDARNWLLVRNMWNVMSVPTGYAFRCEVPEELGLVMAVTMDRTRDSAITDLLDDHTYGRAKISHWLLQLIAGTTPSPFPSRLWTDLPERDVTSAKALLVRHEESPDELVDRLVEEDPRLLYLAKPTSKVISLVASGADMMLSADPKADISKNIDVLSGIASNPQGLTEEAVNDVLLLGATFTALHKKSTLGYTYDRVIASSLSVCTVYDKWPYLRWSLILALLVEAASDYYTNQILQRLTQEQLTEAIRTAYKLTKQKHVGAQYLLEKLLYKSNQREYHKLRHMISVANKSIGSVG